MKRIIKIGAAPLLALLLLTGCNGEDAWMPGNAPEEPNTTTCTVKIKTDLSTQMDGEADTRAGGDATIPTGYRLRYILEVYAGTENPSGISWLPVPMTRYMEFRNDYTTLPDFDDVRLVPGNAYKAICWADLVPNGTNADVHYITTGNLRNLQQVVTTPVVSFGAQTDDAYCGLSHAFSIDRAGKVYDLEDADKELTSGIALRLTRPLVRIQIPKAKLVLSSGTTIASGEAGIVYKVNFTNKQVRKYDALTQKATWVQEGIGTAGMTMGYCASLFTGVTGSELVAVRHYLFASAADGTGEEINVGVGAANLGTFTDFYPGTNGNTPVKLLLTKQNVAITIQGKTDAVLGEQKAITFNEVTP